jgi:hypothetical protein
MPPSTRSTPSASLAQQEVEIAAVRDPGQQGGVALAHRRPVDAVHVLVVEPVTADAPGLVVHLAPLGLGVELHAQAGKIERLGVAPGLGSGDAPGVAAAVEDSLAARAEHVLADARGDLLRLALGEVVAGERRRTAVGELAVEDRAFDRRQVGVVARAQSRQRHRPGDEAFGLDRQRRLFGFVAVVAIVFFFLFFAVDLDFIAFEWK